MLDLTDLLRNPDLASAEPADWVLPPSTRAQLARVAGTGVPVLCLDCCGVAFVRLATRLHDASGRTELVLVDLRRTAGALPADLPDRAHAAHTTLALDGVELLDPAGQQTLARRLAATPCRLVGATLASPAELRRDWSPDLLATVSTITVHAPVLARMGDGVAALAERRLAAICDALGRPAPWLAPDAARALIAHSWPGDGAELDAVLARSVLLTDADVLEARDLRFDAFPAIAPAEPLPAAGPRAARKDDGHAPRPGDAPDARGGEGTQPADAGTPAFAPAAEGSVASPASRDLPAGPSPTLEALAVELAHQLKNPLVTVKTFVASIEALCQDPHELAQFRVLTDEAVTRMDEILEGLLSFARLGAASPESRDVLPLLRDALRATWRGFAAKQVTLEAPDGARCVARVDLEHVRFALAALARHIAETIEPRGTLHIHIEPDGALCFTYNESGSLTHLRGAASASHASLPLSLLLVRGALGRVGGDVQIGLDGNAVSIRLRLAPS